MIDVLFLQQQAALQYARCRVWACDPAAARLPLAYLRSMQEYAATLSRKARIAQGVE